jgi:hypothetical protein
MRLIRQIYMVIRITTYPAEDSGTNVRIAERAVKLLLRAVSAVANTHNSEGNSRLTRGGLTVSSPPPLTLVCRYL